MNKYYEEPKVTVTYFSTKEPITSDVVNPMSMPGWGDPEIGDW